jgi:hypothetical protein
MQLLTESMLNSGESLLRLLRSRRFPFRSALWIYLSEAEEWRLFLAVRGARTQGTSKFYKRLQALLPLQSDPLPLGALAIVDARDPLVFSMGPGIKVGDVARHRFSRGTLNGRYFESAYIYHHGA